MDKESLAHYQENLLVAAMRNVRNIGRLCNDKESLAQLAGSGIMRASTAGIMRETETYLASLWGTISNKTIPEEEIDND